jgi:hypothetical protein
MARTSDNTVSTLWGLRVCKKDFEGVYSMMISNYQIPETLKKLKTLDNILQEQYQSSLDDYLGFNLIDQDEEEDFRYDCTPVDALVFATTGMGGDHFVFNTKKGTIENLEEAPIIFIQPMDFEKPNKLVARNIKDLLSLRQNQCLTN